jgi:phasin family protein
MITQPNDFLMQAWTQQLDGCVRTIETLVEGAIKLSKLQLEALVDEHADLEATRTAMAATRDPARVLELQAQWARANAEKCAAYWRRFYEVGAQTQASLAQCMVPALGAAAPAAVDDSKQGVLTLIDQVYKQWLAAAQQMYKLPAIPAQSESEATTVASARKKESRPDHGVMKTTSTAS